MSEIFIIKNTGKGIITGLSPENIVPVNTPNEGATGDYIPLTGTEDGKPVTGDIKFSLPNDGSDYGNIGVEDDTIRLKAFGKIVSPSGFLDTNIYGAFIHEGGGQCRIESNIEGSLGLYSNQDFSEIQPDNKLIYTQRSYVDKANSYSTDEIKTGGTWIDGKPIYRKVFTGNISSTSDSISLESLNIETRVDINSLLTDGVNDHRGYVEIYKKIQDSEIKIGSKFFPDDNQINLYNSQYFYGTESNEIIGIYDYNITILYTKTTDV